MIRNIILYCSFIVGVFVIPATGDTFLRVDEDLSAVNVTIPLVRNGVFIEVQHGEWGGWYTMKECPTGTFLCGLRDKYEDPSFANAGDDTTMNGLRMHCCSRKAGTAADTEQIPGDGPFGDWAPNYSECPANSYVCGLITKFEAKSRYSYLVDDTALDGVKMKCCDRTVYSQQADVTVREGDFGDWQGGYTMCNNNQAVCGLSLRIEDSRGNAVDDTALNGILMQCCDLNDDEYIELNTIENGIFGDWKTSFVTCPAGTMPMGMLTRYDPPDAADVTALNGIRLRCQSIATPSAVSIVSVEDGLWGTWNTGVTCGTDGYLCGVRTRSVGYNPNQDNSAMNGIAVRCCNFKPQIQISTDYVVQGGDAGAWSSPNIIQCPIGYYMDGYKTRFQARQGRGDDTALNGLTVRCRRFSIVYPSSKPTAMPTAAPTFQAGVTSISPTVGVYIPPQLCTPDNCPRDLGTCDFDDCIYKNGYNGMRTVPKAWATNNGCSLTSGSCGGAGVTVCPAATAVTSMKSRLPGALLPCPSSGATNLPCLGIAGVNPTLFGEAQPYKVSSNSWGLGLSCASGMCYKVTSAVNGKVAYLAVTDRCSGMCTCPSNGKTTPVNCAECIGFRSYAPGIIRDLKPNCQCRGPASNAIDTCAASAMPLCDWCAANDHPHFNLNAEAFQHLCNGNTCEFSRVEVIPDCITKDMSKWF